MDFSLSKSIKKNMATALTLGIVGLVCYSTVKKLIHSKTFLNTKMISWAVLQSDKFKNLLRLPTVSIYRTGMANTDVQTNNFGNSALYQSQSY